MCPSSRVISFSLGNFAFSPGSLREEERAQWLLSHPRQRTDSRHERYQILQALQLAGETWGAGKAGRWSLATQGLSSALGRGGGPWANECLLCISALAHSQRQSHLSLTVTPKRNCAHFTDGELRHR